MALRLRLDAISYSYPLAGKGETAAVKNVSMSVEPGEVLCLAGANGSGKSTLAQLCTGLLAPTSGAIYYGDRRIEGRGALRDFRKTAGLLFQSPEDQLFADTVEKDIAFGPRNHGLRGEELEARVKQASEMVGLPLDELGKRSPFSLSEGQKRRVALAGVLALEPDVLILDEPFIGLDYEGRKSLDSALRSYRKERSASIVIVTHELSHVWSHATVFGLISAGELVRFETREELLSGETDLSALGMQLPQWGALARELLRAGVSVADPADPRSLAGAIARRREAGRGR
ncbi:MAG: ATP-binding cassette domain-containing protein [Candidatus Geothermincolia bacterium]